MAAITFAYAAAVTKPPTVSADVTQSTSFKPLKGGLLASLLLKEPFHELRVADVLLLVLLTGSLTFLLKRRSDRLKRYFLPRPEPMIDDHLLESLSTVIQQDITATNLSPTPVANDKTIPFRFSFKSQPTTITPTSKSTTDTAHTSDQVSASPPPPNDIDPHYAQFDLPEGLQPELFLEQAKDLFRRIQQAWQTGDRQILKHYTTPELFERLYASIPSPSHQPTIELLTIFTDITSASNLGDLAMISVKFHGWSKEKSNKEVDAYSEIWHLENLEQDSQWLITGIQPVSGNLKFNEDPDCSQTNSEINSQPQAEFKQSGKI